MNRLFLIGMIAFSCLILGCGKKGDPSPPEYFAPAAVSNLTAGVRPDGVVLSWDAPSETARGERLIDLASFEIRRGVFTKGEPTRYEDLADVNVIVDGQTGVITTSYSYRDTTTELGKTYDYRVFAFNEDGVSTGIGSSVRVVVSGEAGLYQGR